MSHLSSPIPLVLLSLAAKKLHSGHYELLSIALITAHMQFVIIWNDKKLALLLNRTVGKMFTTHAQAERGHYSECHLELKHTFF